MAAPRYYVLQYDPNDEQDVKYALEHFDINARSDAQRVSPTFHAPSSLDISFYVVLGVARFQRIRELHQGKRLGKFFIFKRRIYQYVVDERGVKYLVSLKKENDEKGNFLGDEALYRVRHLRREERSGKLPLAAYVQQFVFTQFEDEESITAEKVIDDFLRAEVDTPHGKRSVGRCLSQDESAAYAAAMQHLVPQMLHEIATNDPRLLKIDENEWSWRKEES